MKEFLKNFILILLEDEGFDAEYDDQKDKEYGIKRIVWKNALTESYTINTSDVAISKNKIAWVQSSYHDKVLVRIFDFKYSLENSHSYDYNYNINFIPKSKGWGIFCSLFDFVGNYLVLGYTAESTYYFYLINKTKIFSASINPDKVALKNNVLFFVPPPYYVGGKGIIKTLSLPQLENLPDITNEEFSFLGIELTSIDKIDWKKSILFS
jgi:hypothetical protein